MLKIFFFLLWGIFRSPVKLLFHTVLFSSKASLFLAYNTCVVSFQIPTLSLEEIINGITSNDTSTQLAATQGARKMLSRERNPPIDAILDAQLVYPLVSFLERTDTWVQLAVAPRGWVDLQYLLHDFFVLKKRENLTSGEDGKLSNWVG